jgi:hypothetical protein
MGCVKAKVLLSCAQPLDRSAADIGFESAFHDLQWILALKIRFSGKLLFNMKAQADLIHQLEERDGLSVDDIQKLEASFQSFLSSHHDVLGMRWSDDFDKAFLVRQSALAQLRRDLEQLTVEPKMVECFDRWCQKITAPSVRSLLGPIGEDAQQLARKLGRKIQFELKGDEVRILNE